MIESGAACGCACAPCTACDIGDLQWPVRPGVANPAGAPVSADGCRCLISFGVVSLRDYQAPVAGYSWTEFSGDDQQTVTIISSSMVNEICLRTVDASGFIVAPTAFYAGDVRVSVSNSGSSPGWSDYEEIRRVYFSLTTSTGATYQTAILQARWRLGSGSYTPVPGAWSFSFLLNRCSELSSDSLRDADATTFDGGTVYLRPYCCDLCTPAPTGCPGELHAGNGGAPPAQLCRDDYPVWTGAGLCKYWPGTVRIQLDGLQPCGWNDGTCNSLGSVSEKYTMTVPAIDECVDSSGGQLTIAGVQTYDYYYEAGDCTGAVSSSTTNAVLEWGWMTNGNFYVSLRLDVSGSGGSPGSWRIWERWYKGGPGSSAPSADGWIFTSEISPACADDGATASYAASNLVECLERDGRRTAGKLGTLAVSFCC